MTTKTYTVHRTMQDGATEYLPGSTREMTEADAAELVGLGALSLEGEEPLERAPTVRHTFGADPGTAPADYTTATGEGIILGVPAAKQGAKKAQATA